MFSIQTKKEQNTQKRRAYLCWQVKARVFPITNGTKKHVSILFLFVLIFVFSIRYGNAIFMPFAGKILPFVTPALCAGGEPPIMIKPVGSMPPGLYGATAATERHLYGVLTPGSWVIGLYEVIPAPICFIPVPPPGLPIPIPALPIIKFGVSLPSLSL